MLGRVSWNRGISIWVLRKDACSIVVCSALGLNGIMINKIAISYLKLK